MRKLKYLFAAVSLFLTSGIIAQDDLESKLLNQFHKINSEEMMGWVETLCSPGFNGRLSGTPEYIASAEWIASNLIEWGIQPGGYKGSFF